jgi:hypothetical protein
MNIQLQRQLCSRPEHFIKQTKLFFISKRTSLTVALQIFTVLGLLLAIEELAPYVVWLAPVVCMQLTTGIE